MSNIYEALQQAQSERQAGMPAPPGMDGQHAPYAPTDRGKPGSAADVEMLNLYHHVAYLLPDYPNRIIQFIGSTEGEGVSTVVRRFAQTAITCFGTKVLIVDAAHHNPTQHLHYKVSCNGSRKDEAKPLHKACFPAGHGNLYLSPMAAQSGLIPQIHNREATTEAFQQLREIFDLIIIDSSPGTTSADSIAMSSYTDGVIMIIEAERTSWQAAESVKEKIRRAGGNILGIIFNKRRYHIPEFIYRHL